LGHRVVHRISGGRLGQLERGAPAPGGSAGGLPTLLLTTTGRKTGLQRTVPLPYFPHPEGYVVVASFAGNPKNPAWYENLRAKPEVTVQVRARRFAAVATTAGPDERPAIWSSVVASAAMYADYQRVTPREIPLVVLREARG
jgi:deazaflavin-dependent oxidoreductase (nitroreductase family)